MPKLSSTAFSIVKLISLTLSALLISCGGNGGSSTSSTSTNTNSTNINTSTGQIVNNLPIQGITYSCWSKSGKKEFSGITNSSGSFQYEIGGQCAFWVNNIILTGFIFIPNDGNVTPFEMMGINRSQTISDSVAAAAQFIQSLDSITGDAVIQIPNTAIFDQPKSALVQLQAKTNAKKLSLIVNLSDADKLSIVQSINPSVKSLVDKNIASQNTLSSMAANGVSMSSNTSSKRNWMYELIGPNCYTYWNNGDTSGQDNPYMDCQSSSNSQYFGNMTLATIALPGTHDSATAGIGTKKGGLDWSSVAKTQTKDLYGQLSDGIRYLDLRVHDTSSACGTASDWVFYHNSDQSQEMNSYSLIEGLTQIKNYLSDPSTFREIIILDFQNIETYKNDPQAKVIFFATIQKYLGQYMMDKTDPNYRWWGNSASTQSLAGIWRSNDANSQRKQLIVLIDGGITSYDGPNPKNITPSPKISYNDKCAKVDSYNPNLFFERGTYLNSPWESVATSQNIKSFLDKQINPNSPNSDGSSFATYKTMQSNGYLNVLQTISRPSNAWYGEAITCSNIEFIAQFPALLIGDIANCLLLPQRTLLEYGSNINKELNQVYKGGVGWIDDGWLGKRTFFGKNSSAWNISNIIIVDHYDDPSVPWISVAYSADNWYQFTGGQNDFVSFIIRVNTGYAMSSSGGFPSQFQDSSAFDMAGTGYWPM